MEPYSPSRPSGRPRKAAPPGPQAQPVSARSLAVEVIRPRLLDLETTAAYLGVSPWTVREMEAGGQLRRIRIPLPHHGELRKLLFDKTDLDKLIEAWKGTCEGGAPR
jgi:hypothetical protein